MTRFARSLAPLALLAVAAPAIAQQFSQSYEFLKAIRDEDGQKVTEILNEPGTTVVNARDRSTGDGALHIIARSRNTTYLRFLLQKGANPNLQDARGNTPALIAVETRFTDGIDTLILYKANLNLANRSGETPLIRAVQLRDVDMVRRLLAAGANPDQADVIAGMSARDYARRDARSPALLKLIEDAPKRGTSGQASGPKR
ncbi:MULTISPECIES: ankyrin repeat domain-containing protein [unclassified Sphingomonas]|jgi:ankyrin repeat protein|uniref:ankyrin repeat domain-containing protein n=1 Tax=unclassified Sphingomonas TaxID=196159 RepID=UPI00082D384D|nr:MULTISPECIES: ankyrin repeat domain-containing protein [unclassified Sphingomonas]MCH4893595.1 ankyrin repeat domain-containing protein [Sphingomonas sp. SFZ2018-12]